MPLTIFFWCKDDHGWRIWQEMQLNLGKIVRSSIWILPYHAMAVVVVNLTKYMLVVSLACAVQVKKPDIDLCKISVRMCIYRFAVFSLKWYVLIWLNIGWILVENLWDWHDWHDWHNTDEGAELKFTGGFLGVTSDKPCRANDEEYGKAQQPKLEVMK